MHTRIEIIMRWNIKCYVLMFYKQLEKLEAARDAKLVCLSLLSLTGPLLVLLGPSGLIFSDLTRPYLALTSLTWL